METRPFGRTGHASSRVIFGSAGLGSVSQERADEVLPVLLDNGVNHLDTAASYGDAELRLAPWLKGRREEFFLATKTGERSGSKARQSLERSLERLGVERVDLIQLHNLVEEDEWEEAHSPGGAVEALVQAREEGLCSYIGVTGHGLRIAGMHLRSLERFEYDSVLFPYNFLLLEDADYRRDVDRLLEVCVERQVATQAIKSIARRRWQPGSSDGERLSWYEPLTDPAAIADAVGYVLSNEQLFLVSSSDFRQLPAILDAARDKGAAPQRPQLERDVATNQMEAIFDGGELERI